MSYPDPSTLVGGAASRLLQSRTLGSMAFALGLTASAIVITAGHHLAVEEGRNFMSRWRSKHAARRDRNTSVLCALLSSDDIPVEMLRYLETQRDVFRAAIHLSLDPEIPEAERTALRSSLRRLYSASRAIAE